MRWKRRRREHIIRGFRGDLGTAASARSWLRAHGRLWLRAHGRLWLRASGAHGRLWLREHRRLWRNATWLAAAITVVVFLILGTSNIDLQVYRAGGQAWWKNVELYGPVFPAPLNGPRLPFTYPPFAAIAFSTIAFLPWTVALAVVLIPGIVALVRLCAEVAARYLGFSVWWAVPTGLTIGAVAGVWEPARQTLEFGQVNLLLMALVAADCLVKQPRWPRGMLIGLAAAIKLTPAFFILFFLARRQFRASAVALGTFIGIGLLCWALAPRDTEAYWTGALLNPDRIGAVTYAANQSLRGVVSRFGWGETTEKYVWAVGVLIVAALAFVAARRCRARGDDVTALLAIAAAGLLASPVSWSHHWVWAVPACTVFICHAVVRRRVWISCAVAVVCAVFMIGPWWYLPHDRGRELTWAWWQHLLGDAYGWLAIAFLVALVASSRFRDALAGAQQQIPVIVVPPPAPARGSDDGPHIIDSPRATQPELDDPKV